MRKKRFFGSWLDAETAWENASRVAEVLAMALTDLALGKVEWLERGQKKIALSRLGAHHGGIVILAEDEKVGARYLDDWLSDMLGLPAPPRLRQGYNGWLDAYGLALEAKRRRDETVEKIRGTPKIPL